MIHYTKLKEGLGELDYSVVRTNKRVEYVNLPCGFDIESTSAYSGTEKLAFMYIWMIGIDHGKGVYFGRTWEELQEACNTLQEHFGLGPSRRLVIYIHNFSYEFQFMRKYFEWVDVFSVSDRKPIKATTIQGIEFRDSYILSGFSLANTAKNLTTHKVKKMVGDLDYSLPRHHETPLTPEEMAYCENDIAIITAYISEQIDMYNDITKIPTTNTGRVRKHVKDECYFSSKNHRKSSKGKYVKYREIMGDLTLDPETYMQLARGFMGGFTHANANYTGKTLQEVSSIDFTSSYPAVMVAEKFPMSRFKPLQVETESDLVKFCSKYALIFNVKFRNIRAKITQETYLSADKCFQLIGAVENNGRIFRADLIATTLTEIDFAIMMQCYEWDAIELADVKYAHKNYLPKAIVKSVLEMYQGKTTLKDVEGSEVEYLLSKGMLNSVYGMCVTAVAKDTAIYEGDQWGIEKVNLEEVIDEYNKSKNRFLYYPWGVWVTAYARRNLWTGIIAAGDDYVYSDTDSLKVLNYANIVDYVNWYDVDVMDKMKAACDYHGFDHDLLTPKTKDGVVKPIGIWDFEGTYSRFKTLGAKRYLLEKGGKLQITVAGLSKANGLEYMLEKAGGDNTKVFDAFTDSLYIPADRTGKSTHTYVDNEIDFLCVDYLGQAAKVSPRSGLHLEPAEYSLSLSALYKTFLAQLGAGYIFNGVKYQ